MHNRIDHISFWQWAFSDFLSNALRGVLAEYIVGSATDSVSGKRVEWDAYDLKTETGVRIEVKSAAYLQSWKQSKPSLIRFDIAKKQSWYAETNSYSVESARSADVYVFCVFSENNREIADPLDLEQWFFLVAPVHVLDANFSNQKSVALSSLESTGIKRITFAQLTDEIHRAAITHE